MDELDRRIVNRLQDGLAVCERPYEQIAQELAVSEDTVLERVENLLATGMLSRFGPMIHAEVLGGGLTLAAMQVAEENLERAIEQINGFTEVAHNYERDHALNIWFVIATECPEQIQTVINDIERQTGYPVYNFPKQEEYFLNLRFAV